MEKLMIIILGQLAQHIELHVKPEILKSIDDGQTEIRHRFVPDPPSVSDEKINRWLNDLTGMSQVQLGESIDEEVLIAECVIDDLIENINLMIHELKGGDES